MIVSETAESVWLDKLGGLASFDPGESELVVISPHPDDETLGAGALIASHCALGRVLKVIAVTDGEHAYDDVPDLAFTRVREQEAAVGDLGGGRAKIIRLGLPDRAVAEHEDKLRAALLRAFTPGSHVLAPWTGDFHPDHEACGRAAAYAAKETGARLSWYFFWTWHRGTPGSLNNLPLMAFTFGEDLRARKWHALLRHKSQLEHPSGEPILPDNLLGPAKRSFEVFAAA